MPKIQLKMNFERLGKMNTPIRLISVPNALFARKKKFKLCLSIDRNSKNDGHHVKSKNQTYPNHRSPPIYSYSPPEYYYIINATEPPTIEQIAAERERIRMEFFSTYDVMTGIRIATTLGGFFGLMVFLVIYKSRGERIETMKALKVNS